MAKQNLTIPHQVASPSQDFKNLKDTARTILGELTGNNWTDYNSHDPGLTILEACVYALTELSLRSDMDIKDILSRESNLQKDLFTAEEILTAAPLTLLDYRKFIIDLPQIRNAWIFLDHSLEIPIFFNSEDSIITLTAPEQLLLKGLYKLILELETPQDKLTLWGDLNQGLLPLTISINSLDLNIEISFPFWDDTDLPDMWKEPLIFPTNSINILEPISALPEEGLEDFIIRLEVSYISQDGTKGSHIFGLKITLSSEIPTGLTMNVVMPAIEETFKQLGVWEIFNSKIIYTNSIIKKIQNELLHVRNLGEDFIRFQAVKIQEVSINAKIILSSEPGAHEVLAQIFWNLEKFINNPITFSDLSSLLAEKQAASEIFEGPLLANGFISNKTLEDNFNGNIIYISDLIKEILSINNNSHQPDSNEKSKEKRVIAIQSFSLTNFINNQIVNEGKTNCLQLFETDIYKPRFSPEKSKIQFIVGDFSFEPDIPLTVQLLENLKAENVMSQKALAKQNNFDFPRGQQFDLADYHSIQHDFPFIYGLGKGHLIDSASKERKAQAAQLKAYLLMIEQIMADAAAQLYKAKDYFSFSAKINNTYASQLPQSIPNLETLIGDEYSTNEDIQEARESAKSQRSLKRLHHLSARLGEDLREPSHWMLSHQQYEKWETDHQSLLANYPSISQNRGLAYHYKGGNPLKSFIIVEDSNGQFHWKLNDYEGSTLLQNNAPLISRETAQTQILEVRRQAIDIDNYQMTKPDPNIDELRLELYNAPSGNVLLAISPITFSSPQSPPISWQSPWSLLRSHIRYIVIGVWHTNNISGYEKRISALLGLNNLFKRNLYNKVEKYFLIPMIAPFQVTLINYSGEVLLKSTALSNILDIGAALELSRLTIHYGLDHANYKFEKAIPNGVTLKLMGPLNTVTGVKEILMENERIFLDEHHAIEFRDKIFNFLHSAYGREGFHIIEHVLLFPRDNASESALLGIKKNNSGGILPGEKNPYQSRISVIVPNWSRRFADAAFMAILNKLLLQEAPAHLNIDIYRINTLQMESFEKVYLSWLEALAIESPGTFAYRNALTPFVQLLNTIRLSTITP